MEVEGDDANTAHVRNDETFKVAPLSGANSSWQRERWGATMTDHGEDPAGDGEAGEGERGEGGDIMGWGSATMTTSTLLPLQSLPPP